MTEDERMSETEERRVDEAHESAEATVEDLARRNDQLGDHIEGAKKTWDNAQQSEGVATAAGDWEDTEPDEATGEDPSGFDDPEAIDEDEEEDDDA